IRDRTVTGVQTCALPISSWIRELGPESARDLVAHARIPVLDVILLAIARPPELVQVPGHGPGGADHDVAGSREFVDRADDLRLRSEERRVGKGGRAGVWT